MPERPSVLVFRRNLIVEEANRIGVAYLRLDLLPATEQLDLRRLFRDYLDARAGFSEERWKDEKSRDQELARTAELLKAIWSPCQPEGSDPKSAYLLLPALNKVIDVTTERTIAADTHLPSLMLILLISIALASGVLSRYGMAKRRRRSLLHMISFYHLYGPRP